VPNLLIFGCLRTDIQYYRTHWNIIENKQNKQFIRITFKANLVTISNRFGVNFGFQCQYIWLNDLTVLIALPWLCCFRCFLIRIDFNLYQIKPFRVLNRFEIIIILCNLDWYTKRIFCVIEKRKAEADKIRERYSDRIPVICEKSETSKLPDIDKTK
jgi:hypothetical protein